MNDSFKHLGQDYPLTKVDSASKTKERILIISTILFAKRGYADVSMRDIAAEVGIKAASLYNHFEGKEMLWRAVVDHVTNLYMQYFARLEADRQNADSFEGVLDAMFLELLRVVDIFNYYGISLVMEEQFRDEKAGHVFLNVFLAHSIGYFQRCFDECVALGLAAPFDTRTVATIFTHSILIGVNLRMHEDMQHAPPYDVTGMYRDLKRLILGLAGKAG